MNGEPKPEAVTVAVRPAHDVGTASKEDRRDTLPDTPATSSERASTVPVATLLPANNSPRLEGENQEHARALAESDATVPPILVHRRSLRVIDGMHRLQAAILRGATEVEIVYFDGSDDDAFVAAVRANTTHGYPLSRADRRAAATRIVTSHPQWSDRAVAEATGLAARTVAGIRRSTDDIPQTHTRTGRDGRARPLDVRAARQRVSEMVREHPEASLRKIATATGVSPTTVRDVRERMRRGEDPTTRTPPPDAPTGGATAAAGGVRPLSGNGAGNGGQATNDNGAASGNRAPNGTPLSNGNRVSPGGARPSDPASIIRRLRVDPSLRYSEAGRSLIRFFEVQLNGLAECRKSAESAPLHCRYALMEFAQAVAERWLGFAEELKKHTDVERATHPAESDGNRCQ